VWFFFAPPMLALGRAPFGLFWADVPGEYSGSGDSDTSSSGGAGGTGAFEAGGGAEAGGGGGVTPSEVSTAAPLGGTLTETYQGPSLTESTPTGGQSYTGLSYEQLATEPGLNPETIAAANAFASGAPAISAAGLQDLANFTDVNISPGAYGITSVGTNPQGANYALGIVNFATGGLALIGQAIASHLSPEFYANGPANAAAEIAATSGGSEGPDPLGALEAAYTAAAAAQSGGTATTAAPSTVTPTDPLAAIENLLSGLTGGGGGGGGGGTSDLAAAPGGSGLTSTGGGSPNWIALLIALAGLAVVGWKLYEAYKHKHAKAAA